MEWFEYLQLHWTSQEEVKSATQQRRCCKGRFPEPVICQWIEPVMWDCELTLEQVQAVIDAIEGVTDKVSSDGMA